MKKVNKYTRAGKDGKFIWCPKCLVKCVVFHFSWYALVCNYCKAEVQKLKWIMK